MIIGKILFGLLLVGVGILFKVLADGGSKLEQEKISKEARRLQEYSFLLGQAKAMQGDFYMTRDDAGKFKLLKTIWDDGEETLFDPFTENLADDL